MPYYQLERRYRGQNELQQVPRVIMNSLPFPSADLEVIDPVHYVFLLFCSPAHYYQIVRIRQVAALQAGRWKDGSSSNGCIREIASLLLCSTSYCIAIHCYFLNLPSPTLHTAQLEKARSVKARFFFNSSLFFCISTTPTIDGHQSTDVQPLSFITYLRSYISHVPEISRYPHHRCRSYVSSQPCQCSSRVSMRWMDAWL